MTEYKGIERRIDASDCVNHREHMARIIALEASRKELKAADERQSNKIDTILGKQNNILGGIVVSVILLLVNILLSLTQKGTST